MAELLKAFPALAARLQPLELGDWPTPLRRLQRLGGDCRLYVKDDGPSGPLYGGNKVRKLEWLLADALATGCKATLTFGVAGSNHALATALYARHLGLVPVSILTPQRNARYVATNLLAQLSARAEMHHFADEAAASAGAAELRRRYAQNGSKVATIPGGGSSVIGTIGFVDAAFELAAQIDAGRMPEPDLLYVALGTMGTAAGLALGLRACGLATRIVAVRVVREDIGHLAGMRRLFEQTNRHLHSLDPAFPLLDFDIESLRHDQYGGRYAVFTEAGMAARRRASELAGLKLEGTYTAKTVAALLADIDAGRLDGQTVLYWHTYNSRDLGALTAGLDYRRLPEDFHGYFERPVQALDRDD